jgi:ABC-type Zn uptake system ZnuABC Zn-binding protein ZnuA
MRTLPLLAAAALALAAAASPSPAAPPEDGPLRVLATTTDLRELAREVGGDDVAVTCLMKGPEDPHFLEARPSFVRAAAQAHALLVNGLDLEVGYEPILLGDSRNSAIQKGRAGYVDASAGIVPLEVPSGPVDRSLGDVHAAGNPHYLLDPVRAKQAAGTIAAAFRKLAPDRAARFDERLAAFRRKVDVALFGEALLAEQPAERLERRLADGTLGAFLEQRGLRAKLGGHAAAMVPHAGRKVASYHATFVYLLDRFHLADAERLEPKPGVPPSPRHLADVISRMRSGGVRVVVSTSFQPEATAASVAAQAEGRSVRLAHQPGALAGTETYLDALRHNVEALARALAATEAAAK